MSDYEITLINDSMQEFYVRFHGPQESELRDLNVGLCSSCHYAEIVFPNCLCSALRRRRLEDSRRAPRPVPVQVAIDRLYEQDLPSQYRRAFRVRLSRRYQPDLVTHV